MPLNTKKLFALALLSGLASAAQAQTVLKAGTIQLGGNVGYARTSVETPVNSGGYYTTKQTNVNSQFSVAPSVGYFVADNLAVGIDGAYQVNRYKQTQGYTSYDEKAEQFRLGAFVQYYKMVSEQFGFTGTLGGGYQHFGQPSNFNDRATKGAYANLTPSIVFFPIPKLAIGASIGGINYAYTSFKTPSSFTDSDTYASSSFGADFGLSQLLFSGTYYFGR